MSDGWFKSMTQTAKFLMLMLMLAWFSFLILLYIVSNKHTINDSATHVYSEVTK